jgi:[ribosomal protein S5]-alanine N-acetyltransferase
MQKNYKTDRLLIRTLTFADAAFIFELVNTTGWIKFIGDRNVHTNEDAERYIQKILSKADVSYRVVTLQDVHTAVGIVTLIKRNYLEHHDIGFAFLPAYARQGYAFEASAAVLADLFKSNQHQTILATTLKENISSIQLLHKLGFSFSKEITNENDTLQLFSINKNDQPL